MTIPRPRAKVLILSFSPLARDARVLRQARALAEDYDVTTATFGDSPLDGIPHVELADLPPYRAGSGRARLAYIGAFALGAFSWITRTHPRDNDARARLADTPWDLVVANDASALPLAASLAPTRGFVADLHEYAPRQAEESWRFRVLEARYFSWMLKTFLPRAAAAITVSEGIAEEYGREFGVTPRVVTNASAFADAEPAPTAWPLRLVHSAAPSPARRIEVMIKAVIASSADLRLDLYLVDDASDYVASLRALAATSDRVTVLPAVPQAELVARLSQYDVGIHILPPINFNHRWALPNKLFDYVQARLAVVVGPSPEMARVVERHGLGAVTSDFSPEGVAATLDELTVAEVAAWKLASHRAARELSAESQMTALRGVVADVFAEGAGHP